jgi:hypothetical protein
MSVTSPDLLWHYTTQRGLLEIVASRALWATDLLYLSDATEFTYAVDLCLEVLKEMPELSQSTLGPALEPIREGLGWDVSFRICVASFSEDGNLLSQWRAYSDTGGFSLAFDPTRLSALEPSLKLRLEKCVYDRDLQLKLVYDLLADVMGPREGGEDTLEKRRLRCTQRVANLAPTLKDAAFQEEREWRLVTRLIKGDDAITRYRAGRSLLTPYVEIPLADEGQRLPIKVVRLGPTPHADLAWLAANEFLKTRIEGTETFFPVYARPSSIPYRTW